MLTTAIYRLSTYIGKKWQYVLCISVSCFFLVTGQPGGACAEAATLLPEYNAAAKEYPQGEGKLTGETPAPLRLGPDYLLHLFPSGDFYLPYAADPHRTGFGIEQMHVSGGKIPGVGGTRYNLKAGGYFGVLRIQPSDNSDAGVQLDVGGGLDGQFDMDHFRDNIGWNGHYGMIMTAAPDRALSFKLGLQHISAHLGDIPAEQLGRGFIDYSRMEIAPGVSWTIDKHWRTYAEYGWGYFLLNEQLQRPHRVQFGLEYEYLFWRNLGCYAAADLSAMEERNWRFDNSLQLGFVFHSGSRTWRLGFQRYHGRPTMNEFFQNTETSTSFGLWLDL